MDYLVFFFWLTVLTYCITKIKFVQKAELGSRLIVILFLCKVGAGMISGKMVAHDPSTDTWIYHARALEEYQLLFTHPLEYFTNLFHSGYSFGYAGVLQTQHSYWNDLSGNLLIKLVSVFDIFTGGRYYSNVIWYNCLVFVGHIALYRVFKQEYDAPRWLLVALVFLLPSLLFYSSAIHKEGLMLAATGVIIYQVYQVLQQHGNSFVRILYASIAFVLVFLFRNFAALAMLPALMAWVIAVKYKASPVLIFGAVYLTGVILFFTIPHIYASLNLPAFIAQKQADFLALGQAHTSIPVNKLEPEALSYIKNAPQSLQHSLLRPFITDISLSKLLLPLSLELLFYELLIILYLFFKKGRSIIHNPFVLFSLFFGLTICLIIGYTVPVVGAIVRYRSIYLPILLAPFVLNTDWKRLHTLIFIKK